MISFRFLKHYIRRKPDLPYHRSGSSRRHPYFKSLPAILVLAVYGVILIRSSWIQKSLPARYRVLAKAAIDNSQFELAQTYYERLNQLGGEREPVDDLNLVVAKFRNGDFLGGQALLDRLAPDNGVGYSKAHRLKATRLIAALSNANRNQGLLAQAAADPQVNQPGWELVQLHLKRSGMDQPVELADLWTVYYFAAGKQKEAIAQQIRASELKPERWLATARLCARLNDESGRKLANDRAAEYFLGKIKENPFDHSARIDLARAYVDTQKLQEAGSLLLEGVKIAAADTSVQAMAMRRAASDFLLLRIDFITGQSADDLSKKQALVAKAIELDSNNSQAYKKMLELCESTDAPENRQVMIGLLERQVAEGVSIPFAHFALGTAKWIDGNHDEALWHTERALELEPNLSDIANNLAWLSAQGDSPDLQRSLKLIESAIKKRPGDFRYRDTRGVILMKLQRWEEALTDFETILPRTVGDERRELHTRLATIYQQLGKDGMAKIHEQQAQADKE